MPEDHRFSLATQGLLARVYSDLGRPRDGIPLIVDVLEKGEKAGESEYDMQFWRSLLVRPLIAISEPVVLRLLLKHLSRLHG